MTDNALMIAYAQGDVAAFDTLYRRYEVPLLRFIRRLIGQRFIAQAEEVFQETWLRIIAARAHFQPRDGENLSPDDGEGSQWKAWAFTIAHNATMDRLRKNGHEGSQEYPPDEEEALDWLQEKLDPAHPGCEDQIFWRAAGKQLLHCLDRLPENQRAAFLLYHEQPGSVEELAQRLALPFETAKSRLRYALQKLRSCMWSYLSAFEERA